HTPDLRPDCTDALTDALRTRIVVLDGAMGTAIQRDRPDEAGYRGDRFADWPSDVVGNNDLLSLTQPHIIAGIHREYLEAGAYLTAARGLVDGGADILQIETIFDTLNAKAAIFAVETLFAEHGRRWPVVISGTITDASGRTLSGQVTEAFWHSVRHVKPLLVG